MADQAREPHYGADSSISQGEENYAAFQKNDDWVEALRQHKLMALDFKGLTALLLSLKVVHETDRLLQVFGAVLKARNPWWVIRTRWVWLSRLSDRAR